ncbi:MAG TPA: ComEA family DNA-binding protein [Candidatus Limnocylindrales bacterium]
MERDLPWRVLEVPEPPEAPPPPGTRPDGVLPRDPRRAVAIAVLGAGAAVAAVVAAVLIGVGPRPGTLVLDGDAAGPRGTGALVGTFAPDAGLVAGPGLVVDVAGAVLHPGVYHLPAGSRVADAITAAGGFGPRVDAPAAQALNLAAPLTDGLQVRVPSRDDPPGGAASPGATGGTAPGGNAAGAGGGGGPVDLNTATSAQLDTLPGIGPVTAAKIIASREEQPFSAVDDLQTRKLVGATTFAKLAGLVTVGGR